MIILFHHPTINFIKVLTILFIIKCNVLLN
nr:MAG TPA: hypothetical protein [Bacteriophage sp.]